MGEMFPHSHTYLIYTPRRRWTCVFVRPFILPPLPFRRQQHKTLIRGNLCCSFLFIVEVFETFYKLAALHLSYRVTGKAKHFPRTGNGTQAATNSKSRPGLTKCFARLEPVWCLCMPLCVWFVVQEENVTYLWISKAFFFLSPQSEAKRRRIVTDETWCTCVLRWNWAWKAADAHVEQKWGAACVHTRGVG